MCERGLCITIVQGHSRIQNLLHQARPLAPSSRSSLGSSRTSRPSPVALPSSAASSCFWQHRASACPSSHDNEEASILHPRRLTPVDNSLMCRWSPLIVLVHDWPSRVYENNGHRIITALHTSHLSGCSGCQNYVLFVCLLRANEESVGKSASSQ